MDQLELNNQISKLTQEGDDDTLQGKFLTFTVGEEEYGIEISYVIEIIGIQNITHVPEMPQYIKGIINLRGTIIPVMDVRLRFGREEKPYDERTCIIVVEMDEMPIGLIVDQVEEVIIIPVEDIVPPPPNRVGHNNQYIRGIGKTGEDGADVKLIIDCNRLFAGGAVLEEVNVKQP